MSREYVISEDRDYKEGNGIKAYIKDKYGLNVTSLNIAQVKEKHGFEKRENYNKCKVGHRVPNCPPEKEKAIEDAFKHFGIL